MGIRDGQEWPLYPDEPKGLLDEPYFKVRHPNGSHITRGQFRRGSVARTRTLTAIAAFGAILVTCVGIVLVAMLLTG
jgi:hypothetical protein